jgi:hypothetical protein
VAGGAARPAREREEAMAVVDQGREAADRIELVPAARQPSPSASSSGPVACAAGVRPSNRIVDPDRAIP